MWWRRFLDSEDAVSILPDDKLLHLNQSSVTQLEKLQDKETFTQNQIYDVSFKICELFASDEETQFAREYSAISAEERRYFELKTQFNNLHYEIEMIEEETLAQETMLYHLSFSNQKTVTNAQLKKLIAQLTAFACTTDDVNDRDNCVLCMDLLSGNTKILKMKINQNNVYFQRKSANLSIQLNNLITQSAEIVKKIYELQKQVEETMKDNDLLKPLLPKMKEQLKNELNELGNTKNRLLSAKKIVDSLMEEKDALHNELSALSAQLLMKPIDDGLDQNEMEEKVKLKQQQMNLDIKYNQLKHRQEFLKSQLQGNEDSIQEMEKEIQEVAKQSSILKSAIEDKKWKLQRLNEAKIPVEDYSKIYMASQAVGPDNLEQILLQKQEHIQLLERRKQNIKSKEGNLLQQETKYDEQIEKLNELLQTAIVSSRKP